ncbi:MAG: ParB N-terminal domain-containing protein [Planctomycetaceae bacterium]|nr:ParB N-terminal domain-containing protein [Planctomycetaceae bacterium]
MNNINSISINDIQTGERHRKELGDIDGLAHSISDDGLLQPIGVTPDNRLVFGFRRLVACRDNLGWTEVPAVVIDIENLTHGEWIENTIRKDLTLSEMVAITDALRDFTRGGDRRSDQYRKSGSGVTKKEACEIAGWKMDKYDDAKKVVENAIEELVRAMDNGEVSPHAAAQLVDEPEDIQREAVERLGAAKTAAEKRGILKTVRRIKRNKEIAKRREAELKVPSKTASVRIFHCPFQELNDEAELQPESVQCVLTDFPYDNEFIDQISELARFANEILVPGGLLVAYTGQHRLSDKFRLIEEHLTFRWIGTSRWHQKANEFMPYKLVSKSSPFLIYSKGDWTPMRKWSDTLEIEGCEKGDHPYQKPIEEIEHLLQYFTQPGDLVVDPCGGSFTTAVACQRLGRQCVSCDIEKEYVVRGMERLAEDRVTTRQESGPHDGTAPVDMPCSPDDLAA